MLSRTKNQSGSVEVGILKNICNPDPAWGPLDRQALCPLLPRAGRLTAAPFFLGSLCYCKHPWLEAVRCSEELSVGCLQRQAATVVPGCASPLKPLQVCAQGLSSSSWGVSLLSEKSLQQELRPLPPKQMLPHPCSPCWNLYQKPPLKTRWWALWQNQALC